MYQNSCFLNGLGHKKSGYFSVMKYFGYIILTRSVRRVSNAMEVFFMLWVKANGLWSLKSIARKREIYFLSISLTTRFCRTVKNTHKKIRVCFKSISFKGTMGLAFEIQVTSLVWNTVKSRNIESQNSGNPCMISKQFTIFYYKQRS